MCIYIYIHLYYLILSCIISCHYISSYTWHTETCINHTDNQQILVCMKHVNLTGGYYVKLTCHGHHDMITRSLGLCRLYHFASDTDGS